MGNGVVLFRQTTETPHKIERNNEDPLFVSTPFENPNIISYEKKWADGSIAAVDSHGFLHLKSSDNRIPEITIVLTFDNNVSAWASDGSCFGAAYFINTKNEGGALTPLYFIQCFIRHILEGASLPF